MRTAKVIRVGKITTVLISLVVFLVVSAPSQAEGAEGNAPSGASLLRTAVQDQPNFLEDFVFVPGSAVLIEDRYILALYENPEKGLYAVAVFSANCDPGACAVGGVVAYSIFDAQGHDIQLVSDLQTEGRKVRKGFFALLA